MDRVPFEPTLGDMVTPLLPRGLSRPEAARYVGLSASAFDKARREGKYPNPTLHGGRYDRRLLDQAMDWLSGINANGVGSDWS